MGLPTGADSPMIRPMTDWAHHLSGRFIVFDGPDGSGKTTQFHRFVAWCEANGVAVQPVREPGGTSIGEQVRDILLDSKNIEMTVQCELLLYMASRSQLVQERIEPALERGELVLADRFISSTLAYQGMAGGLGDDAIRVVADIAVAGRWPDCLVIFDVDEAVAASRRDTSPDRIESKGVSYHEQVRRGYLEQASSDPARTILIDASADEDSVFEVLLKSLETWIQSAASV